MVELDKTKPFFSENLPTLCPFLSYVNAASLIKQTALRLSLLCNSIPSHINNTNYKTLLLQSFVRANLRHYKLDKVSEREHIFIAPPKLNLCFVIQNII